MTMIALRLTTPEFYRPASEPSHRLAREGSRRWAPGGETDGIRGGIEREGRTGIVRAVTPSRPARPFATGRGLG